MGVVITLNVNILKKLIRLIKDKERSMERVNILEKFVSLYENNQIPNWITILSTVVPIIISIIVLWQNHIIFKRNEELQKDIAKNNEKLQKDIYNNEIKVKAYDVILDAYIEFANAISKIPVSEKGLKALLKKDEKTDKMIYDMVSERDKIILEACKIKLLLKNDTDLIKEILELEKIYKEVVNDLSSAYINNENINVNDILEKINAYQELLKDENYDIYFEKYLSFEEIK